MFSLVKDLWPKHFDSLLARPRTLENDRLKVLCRELVLRLVYLRLVKDAHNVLAVHVLGASIRRLCQAHVGEGAKKKRRRRRRKKEGGGEGQTFCFASWANDESFSRLIVLRSCSFSSSVSFSPRISLCKSLRWSSNWEGAALDEEDEEEDEEEEEEDEEDPKRDSVIRRVLSRHPELFGSSVIF